MKGMIQTALVIITGGLLATLAWEIGAFDSAHPASAPRLLAPVAVGPSTAPPDHTSEWVATILARPLFSRDRRPPSEESAASQQADSLPRLSGVMVGPFGRSAIFAVEGRKPLVVNEGDRIEAWKVETIEAGAVHITGPGGAQTLRPSFRSSHAAPTQAVIPGQRVGLAVSD